MQRQYQRSRTFLSAEHSLICTSNAVLSSRQSLPSFGGIQP